MNSRNSSCENKEKELLKNDLDKKLKELKDLSEREALFISDYFFSLRNEIDYEAERILEELNERDLVRNMALNKIREWMVDELYAIEKDYLSQITHRNKSGLVSTNDYATKYNELKSRVDDSLDAENSTADQSEYKYEQLVYEIESQLNRIKCDYLKGRSFAFVETSLNGFGVLLKFDDCFLNQHEIKYLK